ncbi:Alpha/Beta hydrolase protein [Lentinula aciculospora]|uniref:Alpha/Beta hydrolase protein n=1 Tax=Lentinula aciculospora TaxID=153920 RepID=A0A9W9AKV2_9AGAR|nr:Alpha/Beta hydrolase protein [Lentinula aciculospora]
MLYDKTPQYPHFAHLPFAKEPFKALYVFQRIITTVLLVPFWILTNLPRSRRPRTSWSLRQIIFVNFTRRIYRVTEVAGVTWGTRNPEAAPGPSELKETTFEWAPPLKESLRKGVVLDRFARVPYKRAGCFVWQKQAVNENQIPVVGIFFHGGGYSQLSAHENSRTSHIPRRLMKDSLFTEIYAVEYRLLQHAPLPAVIMDAAAAYSHVVDKYYGPDYTRSVEQPRKPCKIILLGDSSGGNLALALTRWIRDEQVLPTPDGLLLFSPSCDTSHAFPSTHSSYIPRPHASTDYLTDTPEPRALMQRTFLGFKYRPGGTGWGQWKRGRSREGGDQMERHFLRGSGSGTKGLALAIASAASASASKIVRGVKEVATKSVTTHHSSPSSSDIESSPHGLPPPSASLATDTIIEEPDVSSSPESGTQDLTREETAEVKQEREIEEETRSLMEIIHSEYVSPASPRVLRRWGHIVDLYDGSRLGDPSSKADSSRSEPPSKMRVWLTPNLAGDQFDWEANAHSNANLQPPNNTTNTNISDSPSLMDETSSAFPEVKQIDFASKSNSNPQPSNRPPVFRNQDTFTPRNPAHSYPSRYPQFHTLFAQFPKTFILIGDAERLTTEVGNLARAMGKDCDCGVETGSKDVAEVEEGLPRKGLVSLGGGCVQVRWIPDAVHDVFIIPPGWWDEKIKSEVWEDVKTWMIGFRE